MLIPAIIEPVNHLLRNEKWARERLRAHSGKTISVAALPLKRFMLQINQDGEIRPIDRLHVADVSLTFSSLSIPSLLAQEPAAYDRIQVEGDDKLADTLIIIGKQINWIAVLAMDTSGLIGDIAAHRLGRTAGQLLRWQTDHLDRIAQTITAYLIEEKDYLAKDETIRGFSEEVKNLQHDTEQLEQRLLQLIQRSMLREPLA